MAKTIRVWRSLMFRLQTEEDAQAPSQRAEFLLSYIIAAVMTIIAITTKSFWGDEILSIQFASQSISSLFESLSRDYHPPFYFLLLKAWISAFGTSEIGLRVFQGIQGGTLLFLTFLLCKKFIPHSSYKLFWLLVLFSSELWLFMPMLRYYALAAIIVIFSTLSFEKWVKQQDIRTSGLLLLSYVLVVYTDYPSSIVIVFHLLYVTITHRSLILKLLLVDIVTAVAFLPWLIITLSQIEHLTSTTQIADLNASPKALLLKTTYCLYAFVFGETVFPFEIPLILAGVCIATVLLLSIKGNDWKIIAHNYYAPGLLILGILFTSIITTFISKHTSFIYTPSRTLFALPFIIIFFGIFLIKAKPILKYGFVFIYLMINVYGLANWANNRHFLMPVYATPWKEVISDLQGEQGIILVDESLCYEYYQLQIDEDVPELVKPASRDELQHIIAAKQQSSPSFFLFLILIGRESTEPEVP
ncbi:MAG: hypothetical protein EPO24_04245, partial [Bacteroidetes bacterium]